MEEIKIPVKSSVREDPSIKDHFYFIGNKISQKEIQSMVPFFYCDEIGHETQQLDEVCLEAACNNRGLTCPRCVFYKHKDHEQKIVPLNKFVADLIKNQTDKKLVLEDELKKCRRYKEFALDQIREFVDNVIERFERFVAQIHKYYNIFENQFEDAMIKSDVISHKLLYQQHIRRDHFNNYIRTAIDNLGNTQTFASAYQSGARHPESGIISTNFYGGSGQQQQQQLLQADSAGENEYVLRDYERAFSYSQSYAKEMSTVISELKFHLHELSTKVDSKIDLHRLSSNVPYFDINSTIQQQSEFKKQYQTKLDNIFGYRPKEMKKVPLGLTAAMGSMGSMVSNEVARQSKDSLDAMLHARGLNQSVTRIPRSADYFSLQESLKCQIDHCKRQVQICRLFSQVVSSAIFKASSVKTNQTDVSCLCVLCEDVVAVSGRFASAIEFYNVQDRSLLAKVETGTNQGVKCMLFLKKEIEEPQEYESVLVVGTYADECSILSYQIDILKQLNQQTSVSVKTYKKFEKKYNDAVSCLEHLRGNEFFIAGYSSGSVAIFSTQNAIPLSALSNIHEGPVSCLHTVELAKFFISGCQERIRYHYIKELSHERIEQKISAIIVCPHAIAALLTTHSLNEESSYIKFRHLVTADLCLDQERAGQLRILKMFENSTQILDDGGFDVNAEQAKNNSVKDFIFIEPRRQKRIFWVITFGSEHKIKLWEVRSAFTKTLKLWEKDVDDFLKPEGAGSIKTKLLFETSEYANLKWSDVSPKVQVLQALENANSGKISLKFAVVNHLNRQLVDIFELEFMVSYNN